MLHDLGAWLREQRQARGWGLTQMARLLQQAGKANNDTHIPSASVLATYIRRWERGKVSPTERYRLHYCKALDILPAEFGPHAPSKERSEDSPVSRDFDSVPAAPRMQADNDMPGLADDSSSYREPGTGRSLPERADWWPEADVSSDRLMAMIAEE